MNEVIVNRLKKNLKKIKKIKSDAKRIYDRDIPEFPFIVEAYNDDLVVWDKGDGRQRDQIHLEDLLEALKTFFTGQIHLKQRERKKGAEQYEKIDRLMNFKVVQENDLSFYINLTDYLDTGLFLDHRPMRERILKQSEGKKVLNLFCYTGSVSVYAAKGNGIVTSVDMSKTYLDWAIENFKINDLNDEKHRSIRANCIEFLKEDDQNYDLIFCDPPTFSNSKKMEDVFEVEKDQRFLIESCMAKLSSDGVLYFSTNKRNFKLEDYPQYKIKDISLQTIPIDYHDQKIHKCFQFSK